MRHLDRLILLTCIAATAATQVRAQVRPLLVVHRAGGFLRVTAPQFHFLEGKALEQLHNGAAVTYVFDLSLVPGQGNLPAVHFQERFTVSFDLWEERFSILQAGSAGKSASHLTTAMAEAWCLENLRLPVPVQDPGGTSVLKLDCWTVENKGESNGEDSVLTLAGLIDSLSRKGRDAPPHWQAVSAPLHLPELKEKEANHR